MGIEPKQLGWSRRDDWGSHRQLSHRLETNQLVCELIAATLPDPHIGVTAWESTRRAAKRLDDRRLVRPDASLILDVPAGPIEYFLEWDRATETQARLAAKIEHYQIAEAKLRDETQTCSILFVVPGRGRIDTLRRACEALEPKRERHRQDSCLVNLDGRWPMLATTTTALHDAGPLGRVWESRSPTPPSPRSRSTRYPSAVPWDRLIRRARSDAAGATSSPASGIGFPHYTAALTATTAGT